VQKLQKITRPATAGLKQIFCIY